MPRLIFKLWFAMATCLLLAACNPAPSQFIRGEPPQFSIDSLLRHDQGLLIDLAIRNINDQPMEISAVSVKLQLAQTPLASGTRTEPVSITSRGREVVRVEAAARPDGLAMLDQLAQGETTGLPWQMDLVLTDDSGRDHSSESDGWLHPVPGRPNQFR